MENIETTGGTAVPIIKKKHYSIDDYKKKIAPEIIQKLQDDLDKMRETKE